jgi:fumarate hydratase class II
MRAGDGGKSQKKQRQKNQNTAGVRVEESGFRVETDSLGEVKVPAERLWGAQTERALAHFAIGDDRMPKLVYRAYGYVKKAAARVNERFGLLTKEKSALIQRVADEVIDGRLEEEFPLYVWQSGSGTLTNMNVNEVISNRAIQLAGGRIGSKTPFHPNDDVNMSQSSNDTFPTAMHIAAVLEIEGYVLPRVDALASAIEAKAAQWRDIVKIGRTHLQDAVPLTVGQEWSGYAAQIREAMSLVKASLGGLYQLAAGGTAVGTGLNAPPGFAEAMAREIAEQTGLPFVTAPNKFAALGASDGVVAAHAALRGLAVALMKIANDMRWLASGPRCGLNELILPANEPGSSIMPGKVNPAQCEAMMMIAIQVMGNDTAVAFAGAQGNFELNTMRPIMINNLLHSARILADGCEKFRVYSVEGTRVNQAQVEEYVNRSLMLVTALSPAIGYDKASRIAHKAHAEGTTLKAAALASGLIDEKEFEARIDVRKMTGDHER